MATMPETEQHGPDEGCFFCASDDEILAGLSGKVRRTLHMQRKEDFCPNLTEQEQQAFTDARQPGPGAGQVGDGIDPTIAAGYRLEDIRDYSPRDLGFGADGHSDEQTGGERDA